MPQMAPLLWFNLYAFFTVILALIIILSYFIKAPIKINSDAKSTKSQQNDWKW